MRSSWKMRVATGYKSGSVLYCIRQERNLRRFERTRTFIQFQLSSVYPERQHYENSKPNQYQISYI
jgi:hypothetical protein